MKEIYSSIGLSIMDIKKSPMMLAEVDQACVFKRGQPVFYVVSCERMAELLKAEKERSENEKA